MTLEKLVLRRHDEVVQQANAAFNAFCATWSGYLPASAEIFHVGSTAIAGCLTKGDMDICVRAIPDDIARIDALLAARYARNADSFRSAAFSAFKDDHHHPPLGVQLVARGSELDVFVLFRDCLLRDPHQVAAFNALKIACVGQPMESYRQAKADFIARVLLLNSST
ncbi:GrpB family protein [Ralstonia sp. UBA689]|uniref:GrpB family protein n=1 Tax=Ralstonia sp. UBA689 TaxID=1947373 RepID=UPI0025D8CB70|nr:GrpB family protein [Ralstonia sp. UBA689]